jgi:predicted 3-demethylubiquinone-9 3-methyltransferase (glyoxalase superfamily)
MEKVTTFLTFEKDAEQAVNFYVSTFPNSKVTSLNRYEMDNGPLPKGSLLNATFELNGQKFMAMDGGPQFSFEQGTSLFVGCETQEEIDHLWSKLTSDGGKEQPCGWVKDKFGVSWQIIPNVLGEYMTGDPAAAGRVVQAFLQMTKFDIATLKRAYEGA